MFAAMRDDKDDMGLGEDDEEMDSDDDDDDDDIEDDFPDNADGEEEVPMFEQNEDSGDEGHAQTGKFFKAVDPESENVVDSLNDRVIEGSFKRRSGESKQISQGAEGGDCRADAGHGRARRGDGGARRVERRRHRRRRRGQIGLWRRRRRRRHGQRSQQEEGGRQEEEALK